MVEVLLQDLPEVGGRVAPGPVDAVQAEAVEQVVGDVRLSRALGGFAVGCGTRRRSRRRYAALLATTEDRMILCHRAKVGRTRDDHPASLPILCRKGILTGTGVWLLWATVVAPRLPGRITCVVSLIDRTG